MEIPEPIYSLSWWRYSSKSLQRLRKLDARAGADPSVWNEMIEISEQMGMVPNKRVLFDAIPDLVAGEACWHLSFNNYPFGDRLPQEWKAVSETIRGKTNDYGCGLTIGPHVQTVIRKDQADFASVRVLEASFSVHFSGYPASMDSMDAMKSLPTLRLVRQHLEPVLGPLEIEATWSF
jgi:hypothetical protein